MDAHTNVVCFISKTVGNNSSQSQHVRWGRPRQRQCLLKLLLLSSFRAGLKTSLAVSVQERTQRRKDTYAVQQRQRPSATALVVLALPDGNALKPRVCPSTYNGRATSSTVPHIRRLFLAPTNSHAFKVPKFKFFSIQNSIQFFSSQVSKFSVAKRALLSFQDSQASSVASRCRPRIRDPRTLLRIHLALSGFCKCASARCHITASTVWCSMGSPSIGRPVTEACRLQSNVRVQLSSQRRTASTAPRWGTNIATFRFLLPKCLSCRWWLFRFMKRYFQPKEPWGAKLWRISGNAQWDRGVRGISKTLLLCWNNQRSSLCAWFRQKTITQSHIIS